MKKKILSCLLAVAMLATMFVVPVSATSTPIVADGDFEISNITTVAGQTTDFTVTVDEDCSYYATFAEATSSNVVLVVNGETVNKRTGGNTIATGNVGEAVHSREFQNEIMLLKGENTISVGIFDGDVTNYVAGSIGKISFKKADSVQYTVSLLNFDYTSNTQNGTPTQVTWLPDPQMIFDGISIDTPVSFEVQVNVANDGDFIPAFAFNGNANAKITVNGKSVEIDVTNKGTDTLKGSSNDAANYTFRMGEEPVYLNAGENTVKVELIAPASGSTYTGYATGLRFYATDAPVVEPVVLAVTGATEVDGVVTVNYTAPTGTNFDIIVANFATVNGVKTLKAVAAPVSITGADASGSEQINVGTAGDIYEVYIWDSLAGMKPLLNKVIAD